MNTRISRLVNLIVCLAATGSVHAARPAFVKEQPPQAQVTAKERCCTTDWPQWGGSPRRNNAPTARSIPADWDVSSGRNVLWSVPLGSETNGTPVVAHGRVFIGTNNGHGYLPRYPSEIDLGCLLCFDVRTGAFQWQYSADKLPTGKPHDWPWMGICSSPFVHGDRLWLVSNRGELVCLDVEGFQDGVNDGPYQREAVIANDEADIVWTRDMVWELGVQQHNMANCSVTGANGVLFVSTSNGVDNSHDNVPAPDAPSFLAVDQETGDVLWSDNSPGSCILHGQWSSPAFAVLGGIPQVIFAGGDGWLYGFGARGDGAGKSRLLWKFDCNPKDSVWRRHARGTRGNLIATPVIHKGLVYIATGLDPEQSAGRGHLWCIDPIHRSCGKDVSPELAVDADNAPLTRRRIRAVDAGAGERSIPNPDSAAVWHYAGQDRNADGTLQFDESLHHTLSSVAIHNNLVILPDMTGVVHCLDARSGHAHWTCDLLDSVWASPLIVDGRIYIATAGGNVAVFRLSADPEVAMNDGVPIVTVDMGDCIHATPIVAENVLYVTTSKRLYAIGGQGSGEPQSAGRLTNLNAEDE